MPICVSSGVITIVDADTIVVRDDKVGLFINSCCSGRVVVETTGVVFAQIYMSAGVDIQGLAVCQTVVVILGGGKGCAILDGQ